MKLKLVFLAFIAMLFVPAVGFAQGDTTVTYDLTDLFSYTEVLYGAFIIIGGYLTPKIPFLGQISQGVYRVLAWAILTGIGFFIFGTPVLSLAVTYFISTSLYEVFLKPAGKVISGAE